MHPGDSFVEHIAAARAREHCQTRFVPTIRMFAPSNQQTKVKILLVLSFRKLTQGMLKDKCASNSHFLKYCWIISTPHTKRKSKQKGSCLHKPCVHGYEAFDLQQWQKQQRQSFPFQEDPWILDQVPPISTLSGMKKQCERQIFQKIQSTSLAKAKQKHNYLSFCKNRKVLQQLSTWYKPQEEENPGGLSMCATNSD